MPRNTVCLDCRLSRVPSSISGPTLSNDHNTLGHAVAANSIAAKTTREML
jgi:hypothetical protein